MPDAFPDATLTIRAGVDELVDFNQRPIAQVTVALKSQ